MLKIAMHSDTRNFNSVTQSMFALSYNIHLSVSEYNTSPTINKWLLKIVWRIFFLCCFVFDFEKLQVALSFHGCFLLLQAFGLLDWFLHFPRSSKAIFFNLLGVATLLQFVWFSNSHLSPSPSPPTKVVYGIHKVNYTWFLFRGIFFRLL